MLVLPLLLIVMVKGTHVSVRLQIATYAAALFVVCMFCHGELVARKPSARHLTSFYLAISVGGALGGMFGALLAPLIFRRFYELHVTLMLSWLLGVWTVGRWRVLSRDFRVPVVAGLLTASVLLPFVLTLNTGEKDSRRLLASRNFYGVFRVDDDGIGDVRAHRHTLVHGGTVHGLQYLAPELRRWPVSYYAVSSGVGLALLNHPRRLAPGPDHSLRVGVVGLGSGTIAAYGRAGDTFRFYEINPAVEKMARDSRYFSYLADTPARVEVCLGDGRLSLERELRERGSQQFDILVLDAFSSDAIPAHLLTREVFATYLAHLRRPDGIIAVHVSNRALDLRPIAWGLADAYGLNSAWIADATKKTGVYQSDWILVSPSPTVLRIPAIVKAASPREPTRPLRLWTDDYYNLFQILK